MHFRKEEETLGAFRLRGRKKFKCSVKYNYLKGLLEILPHTPTESLQKWPYLGRTESFNTFVEMYGILKQGERCCLRKRSRGGEERYSKEWN